MSALAAPRITFSRFGTVEWALNSVGAHHTLWTLDTFARHKQEMLATKPKRNHPLALRYRKLIECCEFLWVAAGATLVYLPTAIFTGTWQHWGLGPWAAAASVVAGVALLFFAPQPRTVYGQATWRDYTVEAYEAKYGPLPLHARLAVDAVGKVPGAQCKVHVLEQDAQLIDPALEVCHKGNRRIALVWDEYGTIILPRRQ